MLETALLPSLPAAPGGLPWGQGLPAGGTFPAVPEVPASPFALLLEAQVPKPEPVTPEPATAEVAPIPWAATPLADPKSSGQATERSESVPATEAAPPAAAETAPPCAADPALLAQLAQAPRPEPAPAAAASGSDTGTEPVEIGASGARRRPLPVIATAEPAAHARAGSEAPALPGPPPDASSLVALAAVTAPPLRERALAPRHAAPREEAPTGPLAGLGALGAPVVRESPSLATAVPAAAHVAAPVESPEFAHELAARVSVLARDGVQRAELRLHPVELGPVAVQIALDGTQARVDFGAEMLVTRSAIEASLPALAASLRDAGLTLSGGGVSQQMPGQAQRQDPPAFDASGPRGPVGQPEEPVVSGVTRTLRHVRAGGVDLYA